MDVMGILCKDQGWIMSNDSCLLHLVTVLFNTLEYEEGTLCFMLEAGMQIVLRTLVLYH